MKTLGLICGGLALAPGMLCSQAPRTHELTLTPEHVHWGYYDPSVKPVLRVASGDTVRVETMIARGLQRLRAAGVKDDEIPEALKVVDRAVTDRGPGGLLSLGDGHAMQGDGEVTGTALETSLRGTVQVTVRKGRRLTWPRAETPTHYIAMGLHVDLDEAAKLATHEMIDFLVAEKKMSRDEAYVLCSVAADLHVTQVVDGTKGVHVMLAKSIFAR